MEIALLLDIIGHDENFSKHRCQVSRAGCQVSAQPPAKKTAGLIEKETLAM
jgi:hypothetical protein